MSIEAIERDRLGEQMFFEDKDIHETQDPIAKLVRKICTTLKMTNEDYLRRYRSVWDAKYPAGTNEEFAQAAAADRKFLRNPQRVTPTMCHSFLEMMGFDITQDDINNSVPSVSFTDSQTHRDYTFSSSDT